MSRQKSWADTGNALEERAVAPRHAVPTRGLVVEGSGWAAALRRRGCGLQQARLDHLTDHEKGLKRASRWS
jgi:hypothetical protein